MREINKNSMKESLATLTDILGREYMFYRNGTAFREKIYITINQNTKTTKDSFLNSLEKETLIYPIYYCKAFLNSNIQNNDTFYVGNRKLTVRGLGELMFASEPYGIYFYAW